MERRVGQHHPEVGRGGCHGFRHRRLGPPARDHDRPLVALEQPLVGGRELHQFPRGLQRGRHQGEGPVLPVLARAQRRHGRLQVRPAGQVVAAEALDGHDRSGAQRFHRGRERLAAQPIPEAQTRPALGAGVRLGVKAPVGRILVLGAAALAHRERGHRGERPVVWNVPHDREARAAVGAVDERVAVAAVGGVEELQQALVAGRAVGGHARVRLAGATALPDLEPVRAGRLHGQGEHSLHLRQRRRLRREAPDEGVERRPLPLHLDQHPALVVQDEPGQPELTRQAVDVGPEAHALHHPLHAGAHATARAHLPARSISSLSTCHALACASWIRGMCSERVTTTWSASRSEATRPPS